MRKKIDEIIKEIIESQNDLSVKSSDFLVLIDDIINRIDDLNLEIGEITRDLACVICATFYLAAKKNENIQELARNFISSLRSDDEPKNKIELE